MSIDKKHLDLLFKEAHNATQYRNGYCRGYLYNLLSGNQGGFEYLDDPHGCYNCPKKKEECHKDIPLPSDSFYLSLLTPDVVKELINIYMINLRRVM